MLSTTKRKYMFIIYELGCGGNSVRSIDIAKALSVKKASISNMLPALIREEMIERHEDGSILLTEKGIKYASNLYLKYITLYEFFSVKLDSSAENARRDALACLCYLSDENTENMTDYILKGPEGPMHKGA